MSNSPPHGRLARFAVFCSLLAFAASASAQTKFRTLWLPLDPDNVHATGAKSKSLDLNYIATWAAENKAGLLSQVKTTVPAGKYVALAQIYWKVGQGNPLGTLRVNDGSGKTLASKAFNAEQFSGAGEYQRVVVEFSVTAPTEVEIAIDYLNKHYVWVGAISLHPVGRPFYNMAHRRNYIAGVNDAVAKGANGVEFDFHPVRNPVATPPSKRQETTGFLCYHFGDLIGKTTNAANFGAYLANIKGLFDSGKLAMVMFDCKQTFCDGIGLAPDITAAGIPEVTSYATQLVAAIKASGIPPARIVLSVPSDRAKAIGDAMTKAGLALTIDSYMESYPSSKDSEDFTAIDGWKETVKATGASFAGLGKDSSVRGEWFRYAYWASALAKERDTGSTFKKVWFWTVNTEYAVRQCLDYAMDGVLSDYPDMVERVLNETPYKRILTKATINDPLNRVYGAESPQMVIAPKKPANPVANNAQFLLKHSGGLYLGQYYTGSGYYWPQMSSAAEVLQFVPGGNAGAILTYGQTVKIQSNNTSGWKASWRNYNLLGTFTAGVYYYDAGQGDKVIWTIESVDGKGDGEPVDSGDKIRLKNKSYGQFLYPKAKEGKGQFLSTRADNVDTSWTIEKK